MIVLLTGASHTGKTVLAQRILEKYHFSYLSMDLLKMGLIRSGYTDLRPEDDEALGSYLWPIVREMIKTAIENKQDLVVEGGYIQEHFSDIKAYACEVEKRIDDSWCDKQFLLEENAYYMEMCRRYEYTWILIDEIYQIDLDLPVER